MSFRAFSLLLQHQRLDEHLRMEQVRPAPNSSRIVKLKKLKLSIKDRLRRLSLDRTARAA